MSAFLLIHAALSLLSQLVRSHFRIGCDEILGAFILEPTFLHYNIFCDSLEALLCLCFSDLQRKSIFLLVFDHWLRMSQIIAICGRVVIGSFDDPASELFCLHLLLWKGHYDTELPVWYICPKQDKKALKLFRVITGFLNRVTIVLVLVAWRDCEDFLVLKRPSGILRCH